MEIKETAPKLSKKDRLLITGAAGVTALAGILTLALDGPVPTIVSSDSCEMRDRPNGSEYLQRADNNLPQSEDLPTCTVNGREYVIRGNTAK